MPPIDPCGAPVDLLRSCYSAKMRFYEDSCERLLTVNWYFVERTDFVPSTAYCSSVYDDEPGMEGVPVGELADTRQHRTGTIPPGTGIGAAFKGTADQWAGAINLRDRVKPADVCGPVNTDCFWATQSTISWTVDPCFQAFGVYAHFNPWVPPVLTINGVAYTMQQGNTITLPGTGYSGQLPTPFVCPARPDMGYWWASFPTSLFGVNAPNDYVTFLWKLTGAFPISPCAVGELVACMAHYDPVLLFEDLLCSSEFTRYARVDVTVKNVKYDATSGSSFDGMLNLVDWNDQVAASLPYSFQQAAGNC